MGRGVDEGMQVRGRWSSRWVEVWDEGVQVRGRWSSRWVEVWTRECRFEVYGPVGG